MAKNFVRYAIAVLVFTIAVVLWGAYVRATGAGAGCGNHWPLCNGEVVPRAAATQTLIEFTHRVMSGIDGLLILGLVPWAFLAFPRFHPSRLGAVLSSVFLTTEVLIGAALVKLEHVAQNASVGRAYSLSAHLLNTLTLLACLALTAWWGAGGERLRLKGRAIRRAAPVLGVLVLVAWSGAIAALGDTLFPASSLQAALREDFNPAASIFLRWRPLHPLLALLAAAAVSWFAVHAGSRFAKSRPFSRMVITLLGAQLTAGLINLWLLAPIWMQVVHLLVADLLWISLILLAASTLQDSSIPADLQFDDLAPHAAGIGRGGSK